MYMRMRQSALAPSGWQRCTFVSVLCCIGCVCQMWPVVIKLRWGHSATVCQQTYAADSLRQFGSNEATASYECEVVLYSTLQYNQCVSYQPLSSLLLDSPLSPWTPLVARQAC